MDRKGLVIWIIGMLLLGSMAAYLFAQSKRNREELDLQASRNLLMMRDALKKSISDLRWEIRSFIRYRAVLDIGNDGSDKWSRLSNAIKSDNVSNTVKSKNKFKFHCETDTVPTIVFSESITLSGFSFIDICSDLIEKKYYKKALDSLGIKTSGNISEIKNVNLASSVSYESIVREFVGHNTFFDKLVLTDESGEVLYPENLKGFNFKGGLDSTSVRFSDGEKSEIHLNSTPYLVYLTPLVEDNQKIWVLGLKDREDLEKAAYKIDFTMLTILGLALVLLLILTPVLSFVSMDKGDVLTQSRMTKIGFSFLILMIIGGWSCAYFIHLGSPVDRERSYELKIRTELKNDLDSMLLYLRSDQFNHTHNRYQVPHSVNEIFTAYTFVSFITDASDTRIPDDRRGTLSHYRIGACLSCSENDRDYSYISVRHRNYFKHFENVNNLSDFFVERIFSQLDGIPRNIMSVWDSGDKRVRAMSFTLNHLPLDSNRSYLLVKEDGEVIHASNKFEIPFTQLQSVLKTDDWEVFETLVNYGNSKNNEETWDLPLRINGHQYRALISPVKLENQEKTFWFIYLVDPNVYHLKAGLSSMVSLILVALYLIIVSFCLYLPSLFLKKKYNWTKHSFWWLLFREHKSRNFDGVLIALTVMLIVWIALMLLKTASLAQILLFNGLAMLLAISIALYFLRYRAKSTSKRKSHHFQLFILIWFLCLGFLPGYFISNAVFRLEEKIWENTLETTIESTEEHEITSFQRNRSNLFEGTVDSPDHQFETYIYPRTEVMNNALRNVNVGIKKELVELPFAALSLVGIFSVLGIIALWRVTRLLTRQLFWMDFNIRETNSLGSIIQSELSSSGGLRLFLCGCDSLVNRHWVYSEFQLEKDQLEIVDCANSGLILPTEGQLKRRKALLIEDVHTLDLTTPDAINAFLEKIPALLQLTSSIHLIISSGSNWKTLFSKMPNESAKMRFSELMSGFYFEFVPLRPNNISVPLPTGDRFDEVEVEQYFFKQGMLNKNQEDPNARLLIQRYGKAYFYNIWVELSLEEKNVCYSYAKEGFFSYKNHDEVVELFQKGIITKHELGGNLQLFSKTFRYFILSNISRDQLAEIKTFRKKFSNSGNIQWAIISFLIVAIALIGYFERSFFTEIQAVVTGISGFIAFLVGEFRKFFAPKSL
ncbi:hypothetical protein GCM10009119_00430 [Algoriphagus jejuensis]|uniref:Uncharacterized protein n=1 Tax=Algoriphagus jejuensis TaxID=419934 RepID=A0ABP3Y6J7_9BACT